VQDLLCAARHTLGISEDGFDVKASTPWFEGNKYSVIGIGASVFGVSLCCCICAYLLGCCSKTMVHIGDRSDTPKARNAALEDGHGFFASGTNTSDCMVGSINERLSFHRGTGASRHALGHLDRRQARAEKLKDNIMSRSTRLLASKAQQSTEHTAQVPDYRQDANARGAWSGPMSLQLLVPTTAPDRQSKNHRNTAFLRSDNSFKHLSSAPGTGLYSSASDLAPPAQSPWGAQAKAGPVVDRSIEHDIVESF